jgi:two-component system sensor histidine kinase YesM
MTKTALKKIFINLRMREKMILTFILFGFIPLLIFGIFQINSVIRILQEELEQAAGKELETIARRIDEKFDTYNRIANVVVFDPQLSGYLTTSYSRLGEAIDLYHYVWNQFTTIIKDNPDIHYATIYTVNTGLVTAPPYLVRLNDLGEIEDYAFLRNAQIRPYIGSLRSVPRKSDYWFSSEESGEASFSFNRAILRNSMLGRQIGIMTLGIGEDVLLDILSDNDGGMINFVVDHRNHIVSEIDPSITGSHISTLVPPHVWDSATQGGVRSISIEKDVRLLTFPLSNGWYVGSLLQMDSIFAAVRKIQYFSLVAAIVVAAMSVTAVSFFSSVTTRRLKLLLDKMKAADIPNPGIPIEGNDEIGVLDKGFREMAVNLSDTIRSLYHEELEKREAQLNVLQSRINPHFLYNTLSSISWMTRTHTPDQVRGAVEMLASYYRTTLSGGRDVITLKEEIEGLRAYIAIRQLRSGGRIRAAITIDNALEDIMLPKMSLQPLVENSIDHGSKTGGQGVSIVILSKVEGGDALISVCDDGPGIDGETLAKINEGSLKNSGGYGIYNVQMRLKLHFGPAYGLSVANRTEGGLCAVIRIPLEDGADPIE